MKPPETLDLTLREGVMTYIESILLADVRKAFEMRKTVQPFGVALATMKGNTHLARPLPMAVGSFGAGLRNTKRMLRQLCVKTRAEGAVLVQLAEFERKRGVGVGTELVLVQLEHKRFGDITWSARVSAGELGTWTMAALANAEFTFPRTTFLPGRWMH